MNREEREFEIDLLRLFKLLWSKALIIALVTVVFGVGGYICSRLMIEPVYQANAKMIVVTQTGDTGDVSNDRLNSAKNLVDTYAIIIRDRDVINRVINELALTESYESLVKCISVKSVNNTQVMQVVVRHTDRELALAVADKIQKIAPSIIVGTAGVGAVNPVGSAFSSEIPVAPSNVKNAAIVAIVGFLLVCGVFVVVFLADNTYESELEIQNDFDVPMLGVIPKIECCGKRYGYAYAYHYGYGRKGAKEE